MVRMNLKIVEEPEKKKRKRYNKNKKKAWRKKIDISDIEEALNQQRREERLGGVLGDRKAEDLFEIDFELEREKLHRKNESKKKSLPTKRLKCHQFLDGLPGVKPITKIRPTCPQYPSKVMRTAMKRSGDTLKDDLKRKIAQDQRKAARLKNKRDSRPLDKKPLSTCDIWAEGAPSKKVKISHSKGKKKAKPSKKDLAFLNKGLDHYKAVTKKKLVKAPSFRTEKPNLIPAITIPHSGISYNPSFEEHQKLMKKTIRDEEKKAAVEQKKKALRKRLLTPLEKAPTQKSYLQEMSEGLHGAPDDEDSGRGSSDENKMSLAELSMSVSAPRITEKKTKQQRMKAKRLKMMEKKREEAKKRRMQESNVFKVKTYLKEIKVKDELLQKKLKRMKMLKQRSKFTTKQLSKYKFVEPEQTISLGDELPEALRSIAPKGSIMEDQFKSLQRRNIIEVRSGRAKKQKRKAKMFIKRSKNKGKLLNKK